MLPLRALNEDRLAGDSIAKTFNGAALPVDIMRGVVDEITARVLDGTFGAWRYANPTSAFQLAGLSDAQVARWASADATQVGNLRIHECEPGDLGLFWATKIGGPSHGFDYEGQCLLPLLANGRHKVILVSDPAYAANPAGRAHFRLLWTDGGAPVLWLEAVNVDFVARIDASAYEPAVLAHAARKARAMGVALSVAPHLERALAAAAGAAKGAVATRSDRLVLRPSNAAVEASDYLSQKHDWLQVDEETTGPHRRAVYAPPEGATGLEKSWEL